jgi:hypothetical protein
VNNPSDPSGERPVTSAVIVLRGRVRAVGVMGVARPITQVPVASAAEAATAQSLASTDGGSTGGLLDLISELAQGAAA